MKWVSSLFRSRAFLEKPYLPNARARNANSLKWDEVYAVSRVTLLNLHNLRRRSVRDVRPAKRCTNFTHCYSLPGIWRVFLHSTPYPIVSWRCNSRWCASLSDLESHVIQICITLFKRSCGDFETLVRGNITKYHIGKPLLIQCICRTQKNPYVFGVSFLSILPSSSLEQPDC